MGRLDAEGGFRFSSTHWLPMDEALPEVEPSVGALLQRSPTLFDRKLGGLLQALLPEEEAVLSCAS
jgi:hypothetical protein